MRAGLELNAERARLQAERNRLLSQREREEADCKQRFAVTGCIESARAKVRGPLEDLDRQERVLDDLDRRARSAVKREDLERRQADAERRVAEQRARAASDQAAREERAAAKAGGPKPTGTPRASTGTPAADAGGASGLVAANPVNPASSPRSSPAVAPGPRPAAGPSPGEARANAQAHADRVRQAEEHKASVQRRLASRAKPPASDLPPPR